MIRTICLVTSNMNNLYSKTKFYLFHSFIPFLLVFTPHRAHCPSSWGNTPPLGSSPSSTVRIRMTLPTLNPACVIWNEVVINRRKRTHFTCWAFLLVFFFFQWDLMWGRKKKKIKPPLLWLVYWKRSPIQKYSAYEGNLLSNRSCSCCVLDCTATSHVMFWSLTPEIW